MLLREMSVELGWDGSVGWSTDLEQGHVICEFLLLYVKHEYLFECDMIHFINRSIRNCVILNFDWAVILSVRFDVSFLR